MSTGQSLETARERDEIQVIFSRKLQYTIKLFFFKTTGGINSESPQNTARGQVHQRKSHPHKFPTCDEGAFTSQSVDVAYPAGSSRGSRRAVSTNAHRRSESHPPESPSLAPLFSGAASRRDGEEKRNLTSELDAVTVAPVKRATTTEDARRPNRLALPRHVGGTALPLGARAATSSDRNKRAPPSGGSDTACFARQVRRALRSGTAEHSAALASLHAARGLTTRAPEADSELLLPIAKMLAGICPRTSGRGSKRPRNKKWRNHTAGLRV